MRHIAQDILDGNWPNDPGTLDEQVLLINECVNLLAEIVAQGDGENVDDEVENFIVWISGLHGDLHVYGWNRLPSGLDFEVSEKVDARLLVVHERVGESVAEVTSYQDVAHWPWPKEFLEGTFEDRLERLAGEIEEPTRLTADMVLMGQTSLDQTTQEERFMVAGDALAGLEVLSKGPAFIYEEKATNFTRWLANQEPELILLTLKDAELRRGMALPPAALEPLSGVLDQLS